MDEQTACVTVPEGVLPEWDTSWWAGRDAVALTELA
jgi:hypothetical protein